MRSFFSYLLVANRISDQSGLGPLQLSILIGCFPLNVKHQMVPAFTEIIVKPAWDSDFKTADLPILMPMSRLDGRYAKHFMGKAD